jgi:Ser/Thr protein kinase RdoA (MazF antagonist)
LELAGTVPGLCAPGIYGANPAAEVVVMEDMGPGKSLSAELLDADGSPDRTAECLASCGSLLARLHAASRGAREAHRVRRYALGEPTRYLLWIDCLSDKVLGTAEMMESWNIPVSQALRQACSDVAERLRDPRQLCVLTHGDAAPHNFFLGKRGPILLDFETAGFRHALLDIALRTAIPAIHHLPYVLPSRLLDLFEEAYRLELARTFRELEDDLVFFDAMSVAHAGWAAHALWLASTVVDEDQHLHGTSCRRRVLHCLREFVRFSIATRRLEVVGAAVEKLLIALTAAWGAPPKLPLFPVFQAIGADDGFFRCQRESS